MACGTHLSCGIPSERCRPQSEVGASDKGQEVLGRISGFWLLLLLGKTTKSRHPHRQRSRQNFSALGTHLPGHKGTEVCWALATTLRTGLSESAQPMGWVEAPQQER